MLVKKWGSISQIEARERGEQAQPLELRTKVFVRNHVQGRSKIQCNTENFHSVGILGVANFRGASSQKA